MMMQTNGTDKRVGYDRHNAHYIERSYRQHRYGRERRTDCHTIYKLEV